MCFSVNVNLVKDELEDRYGAVFPDHHRHQPSYYYHAFSLPELPAVCSESPGKITLLRWGLIPHWVRSHEDAENIRVKTFNARAETIDKKPSFSYAFKSKRCIIPVKGFYEWQHLGDQKIPWYIYNSENDIMSIAGLYESWMDTNSGTELNTFSIITTDANEMMAVIHNSKKRMPAILTRDIEKRWIAPDLSRQEALDILKPCPSGYLMAHTISKLISNKLADKNTPEVIKPYSWGMNDPFFRFS